MPDGLSSGEMTLLSLLIWQLIEVMRSLARDPLPIRVLLLDEPDRHLDPDFIERFLRVVQDVLVRKQRLQIIMTSHRADTIALAPAGSIFALSRERIVPCHRLLATLRLSRNLRSMVNVRVRVHTESAGDASFYQRLYDRLLQWRSDPSRVRVSPLKPVSSRYLPDFHSVASTATGFNGGCSKVMEHTLAGFWAAERANEADKSALRPPQIVRPFGVLDRDTSAVDGSSATEARLHTAIAQANPGDDSARMLHQFVLMEHRYSLDNCLYDPFLLLAIPAAAADALMRNDRLLHVLRVLRDTVYGASPRLDSISICLGRFLCGRPWLRACATAVETHQQRGQGRNAMAQINRGHS